MKIKDLIAKLQTFDPELEVIIMDYDGHKEKGEILEDDSFSIEENIRMWGGSVIPKALVIQ
jgi:hypothetical protein